jgi:hypothetical protein
MRADVRRVELKETVMAKKAKKKTKKASKKSAKK